MSKLIFISMIVCMLMLSIDAKVYMFNNKKQAALRKKYRNNKPVIIIKFISFKTDL
jgi:hypothetical protein